MDEDKSTDSQKELAEVQMKVIASVVRGLLEKMLKDYVGRNMFRSHWEVDELNFKYGCACKCTKQGRNETYRKTALHML